MEIEYYEIMMDTAVRDHSLQTMAKVETITLFIRGRGVTHLLPDGIRNEMIQALGWYKFFDYMTSSDAYNRMNHIFFDKKSDHKEHLRDGLKLSLWKM